MRPALVLVSLAMISLIGACEPPPASPQSRSLENDYLIPQSSGLGKATEAVTVGDGPQSQQVLYINFDGATITRGDNGPAAGDNAATNTSWVPNMIAIDATIAFPAFDTSVYAPTYTDAQVKAKVVSFVTGWYSKYNVYVTSTRPTSGRYTMMMVGFKASSFISSAGSAVGIAPLDCGNSSQTNIGFAFAASLTPAITGSSKDQSIVMVAQTVAHEAGHTFGLEHVTSPGSTIDIMEPAVDPGVMGFLLTNQPLSDGHATCGTMSDTTEDTAARVLTNVGPAPMGTSTNPKPTVTWLAPKDGTTIPYNFTLAVSAAPGAGSTATITKVEIDQSNVAIGAPFTAAPYQAMLTVPSSIASGSMITLTAVVTDSLGGTASATSTFTVSSSATQPPVGCLLPVDCVAPQTCTGGMCVDPAMGAPDMGTPGNTCVPACTDGLTCQADGTCALAPTGDGGVSSSGVDVGKACTDSAQCGAGGLCAATGTTQFCTRTCDVTNACPSSYACTAVGAEKVCTPKAAGGCSFVGGGASGSAPLALLFIFVLVACVATRRRASRIG